MTRTAKETKFVMIMEGAEQVRCTIRYSVSQFLTNQKKGKERLGNETKGKER